MSDPVFYPAFYRCLAVFDPAFYWVFDSASAMVWYFLNWTVSVMMMAVTVPMSFGLESSAATNWSA